MAPDRGSMLAGAPSQRVISGAMQIPQGHSFTLRGILVGLLVGLVICFSNMYFGLQTGWVSTMTLPASLMGFGMFKTVSKHLSFPFTPVENVLVQTVAGSMAIMPLGCGFVGVLPAMNYLLTEDEQGPIDLGMWKLIIWSLGLCYFGVVFAVPLRRQVIIREKLRFPSGFSTAVLIGVLHGQTPEPGAADPNSPSAGKFASLVPKAPQDPPPYDAIDESFSDDRVEEPKSQDWAANIRLLAICFVISGVFTLAMYFFPILRRLPVFGPIAADVWLWTLNPSLAYVGQGIIMGPETTLHMLLGAVFGWAVLSPLAHFKGWAPGHVKDWNTGSKGWIVWVSLSIMLADAVINLAYIALRSLAKIPPVEKALQAMHIRLRDACGAIRARMGRFGDWGLYSILPSFDRDSASLVPSERDALITFGSRPELSDDVDYDEDEGKVEEDAPPEQQVGNRTIWLGLVSSIALCVGTIHAVFGELIPLYATVLSVAMALVLSVMGVRALGETDLNPVSGISKLAQLFFAFVIPSSNKAVILINLISGAVSEAGALQAGELMQDLKTGHLLGAAPTAQFWGQVIGATVGAVVSAFIYRLYTAVYEIPGKLFEVPTAYVWIFTARLVTGKGLPPMAKEWALGAGLLFAATTIARIATAGRPWRSAIPGGIAVAVGMYNVPSFTLARAIGGVFGWYWSVVLKRSNTPMIVMASGFILGEGFLSIVNLFMESVKVPHY